VCLLAGLNLPIPRPLFLDGDEGVPELRLRQQDLDVSDPPAFD
jgi:hypothetical protein